jgi:hypothetical protein
MDTVKAALKSLEEKERVENEARVLAKKSASD